jgi:hypothetical protein
MEQKPGGFVPLLVPVKHIFFYFIIDSQTVSKKEIKDGTEKSKQKQ